MLQIHTFDQRAGGNVPYKALAHPLAAEKIGRLYARLREAAPVALYDPDGIAEPLLALYPDLPALEASTSTTSSRSAASAPARPRAR